jgi:tRNA dimethylallyltransferase
MQVYRGMDIGTAKPDERVRDRLPHHLIDVVDPGVQFSAGDFVRLAETALDEIWLRAGVPILCGGTAFYLRNFAFGLPDAPPADLPIRRQLRQELAAMGLPALYTELERCDPSYAAKIGAGDRVRILRAVEVFRATGRPLSSFAVPKTLRSDVETFLIGLTRPREELYRRIDRRVDDMIAAGLEEEVWSLRRAGYGLESPGLKAIGYREFLSHGEEPLGRVVELIKRNTRRYAKRQMAFFRSLPGVLWFDADDVEGVGEAIRGFLQEPQP